MHGVQADEGTGARTVGCKTAATGSVLGEWPHPKKARAGSDVENSLGLKQPAALIGTWQPQQSAAFMQVCLSPRQFR